MTITPNKPIRVMIVDDHTMVRRGLVTFLKAYDDLELAGEAGLDAAYASILEVAVEKVASFLRVL